MVSAQIAGTYTIEVRNPRGDVRLVKSATATYWSPGGSSEGVPASLTPDLWNFLAPSAIVGGPGYQIIVSITAGAAATMDASDGFWQVPIIVNGNNEFFGNDDAAAGVGNDNFVVDKSPGDDALVANVKTPVQVLRAKEGVFFRIGGDKVNMSIENNA